MAGLRLLEEKSLEYPIFFCFSLGGGFGLLLLLASFHQSLLKGQVARKKAEASLQVHPTHLWQQEIKVNIASSKITLLFSVVVFFLQVWIEFESSLNQVWIKFESLWIYLNHFWVDLNPLESLLIWFELLLNRFKSLSHLTSIFQSSPHFDIQKFIAPNINIPKLTSYNSLNFNIQNLT